MRLTALVGVGVAAATAATLAACGNSYGPGGGGGCTSTTMKVCVVDNAFSPTTLTVAKGTTVTWQNGGGVQHTVTSDTSEPFNTTLNPGQTTTHQFNTAGSFAYHCQIHAGMTGSITVNP